VQLALEQAVAQYPDARTRRPAEFFDDRYLRELESSGFAASLYR
jgi:hypothetical protein